MLNFLGLDISKDTIDSCVFINDVAFYSVHSNDENGFFSILSLFHSNNITRLGFESTGNYHKKLEKYLVSNGVNPYILKPLSVSNFRKSLKIHGKTDKTDSYAIARFLRDGDISDYLNFPIRDTFKPIISTLNLLDKQLRQIKNLKHSLGLYPETSLSFDYLTNLERETLATKNIIQSESISLLFTLCPESLLIKNDIKGVGDGLLLNLIPFIYDNFDKFTLKQISAFFGLNPVSYQSGTSVYKRDKLSKGGNQAVKKALYMSSVSSVRTNPILKEKYLRLKQNGKPSKVALVSIMSHLLRTIVIKLSQHTKRSLKK